VGTTPKTASKAVVFGGLPTDMQLLSVQQDSGWLAPCISGLPVLQGLLAAAGHGKG
jgi:hypothetical protein